MPVSWHENEENMERFSVCSQMSLKCDPLSALRYLEPHWYMKKLPNQVSNISAVLFWHQ